MRGKAVAIIFCISIISLLGVASIYILGLLVQPRVQLSVQDIEWENQPIQVILRFESDEGAFTTGKIINVHALILHHSGKITQGNTISLYFPNTLTTDQYNKLKDDTQWRTYSDKEISSVVMPNGLSETPVNLVGAFPTAKFDTIWTQEGLQDGYLLIQNSSNVIQNEKPNINNAIKLDKIINIEPADVLQNLQTTNVLAGVTWLLLAITLLTAFVTFVSIRRSQIAQQS